MSDISNHKPSVVFFGSGPVAAASMQRLAKHCLIELVITKSSPAHHKGPVPVIDACKKLGIKYLCTNNKAELDKIIVQESFKSQVGVLIDFGIIVSKTTIDSFKYGIINSHFSLLPEWRGADPITFSILSGQQQTGVSLMLLVEVMDEGPILAQQVTTIDSTETTSSLTEKLIGISDALLQNTLPAYLASAIHGLSQQEYAKKHNRQYKPSYSRKLTKQDGQLDFFKPAAQLEREIRAFDQWPKSYTRLGEIAVIITKARVVPDSEAQLNHDIKPGGIIINSLEKSLSIKTAQDILSIIQLKPLGKNLMSAESFLAGYSHKIRTNH